MDVKCGPLAYGGVGANMTVMFGDYGISSRQPQPAPSLFGGEIRIENLRENFCRDAATVVSNKDPDILAGADEQNAFVEGDVFRAHFNYTTFRHGLPSIKQHVVEDLTDLSDINFGRPQIVRDCKIEPNLRSSARQVHRSREQLCDRSGANDRCSSFAERQQLGSQRGGALAGCVGLLKDVAYRVTRFHVDLGQVSIS